MYMYMKVEILGKGLLIAMQGSVKCTVGVYRYHLFSLVLGRVSNFRNGEFVCIRSQGF